jgi:hypothetical protein
MTIMRMYGGHSILPSADSADDARSVDGESENGETTDGHVFLYG